VVYLLAKSDKVREMEQKKHPIADPVVVLREEFDDWALLFNPDTRDTVGIDPVGVQIWKLMDGKHDLDMVVGEIRERFSDVPDTVVEEVQAFIDDLVERGFLGFEVSS
jgi:SynChlorMet cassette protein ScmD